MTARHGVKSLQRWSVRKSSCNSYWQVISPEGAVHGNYDHKDRAETSRDHMQARDDLVAKRITRACMRCSKPFESEGIHNRMCAACRHFSGDGWDPYGLAPRTGRQK